MSEHRWLADHIHAIGSSGIRRVFDLGASLKDPINLSIGQPDFPVPPAVKRAMVRAIEEDRNGYTVTRGIPELRERLIADIAAELSPESQADIDLVVTCGVSGGLLLALMACVSPGDEVLFADPYFVSYVHLVRLVHGQPVPIDTYNDFRLNPERFEKTITPKTKMIVLNSPGNPTGIIHREDDLRAICELARKHDLLIVSDEIYRSLTYEGPSPSAMQYAPERTVVLRGFGKSHAMTGLRIAYAAGPPEIISEMAKLQQYTFVCAPQPAQVGALAALDVDMSSHVLDYGAKRDLVCGELEGAFDFARPAGGFYVFPRVPDGFANATAFVEKAIEKNVLIIPGEVFSQRDDHFRISYAAPNDRLRQGCEILRSLAGK